jgi:hypothetical protein
VSLEVSQALLKLPENSVLCEIFGFSFSCPHCAAPFIHSFGVHSVSLNHGWSSDADSEDLDSDSD